MSRAAFVALWLLVFTIPWENSIAVPGLGTISRVVGAGALGIGLFATLVRGRIRAPGPFFVLATMFVIWSGLTAFWSIDPEETRKRIQTYAQLVVMAWLVWEFADAEDSQAHLLQAFIFGCWLIAASTFWAYLQGSITIDNRYTAEGSNANDVALTLVLGIPMAWYLAVTHEGLIWRWLNRAYVPVALLALLLTASRGAFIAALAALALIPWTFGRLDWRSKLVLSIIVVATAWAIAMVVPAASWERLATTQSELSNGTIGFRKVIWKAGLNVALDHPVVGVGAGAFPLSVSPALGRLWAAHNAFLAVLVEQGVVGLLLFASLFVAALVPSWRPPPVTMRFRVVLVATLVIGVLPLNWDYIKTTWFILALLTAQGALAETVGRRVIAVGRHNAAPLSGAVGAEPVSRRGM